MNPNPLVSVIIPSYNCESYIKETIESVLSQDYKNIELIVIDDGSTDATTHIVKSFGNMVKIICTTNGGVCRARNIGLKHASGQYICFLDHDDYWLPDKITQQIKTFEEYPDTGIVYSRFLRWTPDSQGHFENPIYTNNILLSTEIDSEYSGWIYHLLLLDCWVLTSTAMIKSEVLASCGAFDETLPYSEDWDLWLRISRKYQFIKLTSVTTLYRQHPQQGNRQVRPIDYRTTLLKNAKIKWGLCSPDGICLNSKQFQHQLAEYHMDYAIHQLKSGQKNKSIESLMEAWLSNPFRIKYIAYILFIVFGWRPSW
jgi:glycosyltransferase involved in cell wall biosynthesis